MGKARIPLLALMGILLGLLPLLTCSGSSSSNGSTGTGGTPPPPATPDVVTLAWNDLGMHCLNPTYDQAVILPPYNTLWVQVVKRGNPPQVLTSGLRVEYRLLNNSASSTKRSYGQFWNNCLKLFGITLTTDTGLNLEDPTVHNGLTGTMLLKGDHFQANGIPVVPVDDSNVWNPYQVALITVKDSAGQVVAQTRATVPTSDEINCAKCHGSNPLQDVLAKHDTHHGTTLVADAPVLCASCHGSPALGQSGAGSSGKYLSRAIHGFHADKGAACYDCHPGTTTQCSRSIAHTAADGNCTACHGTMAQVASSIDSGRVPWVSEPKCATCHNATSTIAQVDTGTALYRNSKGHGGVYCAACHGSPHAMVPSNQASDNYQSIAYQGKAKSIASCAACHSTSRPGSAADFVEEHGSSRASACSVCHTGFQSPSTTANWPHAFQWKARS